MIYSTCLQPSNENFPEAEEAVAFSKRQNFRYEHPQRKWEYGLALKFLKDIKPNTVLNVGGGASPLSSLARLVSTHVTEIDPTPGQRFEGITYMQDNFPSDLLVGKYDVVLCTSVIEHVEDDLGFFLQLLNSAIKGVFITMDFHPSGKQFSYAHNRTYNLDTIKTMIDIADSREFTVYGEYDYTYATSMVYDYTFASLALIKS